MPRPLQRPHPPIHVAAVAPRPSAVRRRGLPILADPAAPFKVDRQGRETWHEAARAAGDGTDGAELVVSRSVYVAPTVEQARADQAASRSAFDRSRIFNEKSAPIDCRTRQVAKGFEYWQDRYLKGGDVGADFRWEQLEVIGDPERVIAQIKMLEEFGFTNLLCDFGSTRRRADGGHEEGPASSPPKSCPPSDKDRHVRQPRIRPAHRDRPAGLPTPSR